jgi:hypothetical protein
MSRFTQFYRIADIQRQLSSSNSFQHLRSISFLCAHRQMPHFPGLPPSGRATLAGDISILGTRGHFYLGMTTLLRGIAIGTDFVDDAIVRLAIILNIQEKSWQPSAGLNSKSRLLRLSSTRIVRRLPWGERFVYWNPRHTNS